MEHMQPECRGIPEQKTECKLVRMKMNLYPTQMTYQTLIEGYCKQHDMMKAKRLDHTGVPAAIAYCSARKFAAARAALSLTGNSGASVDAASR